MDDNDVRLVGAAQAAGLSISPNGDGTWTVGASPELSIADWIEPSETVLGGGLVQLPDGRVFKRHMTTSELRALLGLEC
jgi:hypothetical protein